jgi:hypothetical protein
MSADPIIFQFRKKLLAQFKSFIVETAGKHTPPQDLVDLYMPSTGVRSYSIKTLERLLQDTDVLTVNPDIFNRVHLQGQTSGMVLFPCVPPLSSQV